MRKFEPSYWTVNFNIDCAAALTTPGVDEMKVTIVFRTEGDLVGLIWSCEDLISHPLCRYKTDNDLSGSKLEFDFSMSGVSPMNSSVPPTLTVEHLDGGFSYIRLVNYATVLSPDGLSGHIALDFADVMGGWDATDPVTWTDIKQMFISLIPAGYSVGSSTPLAMETEAEFHATNIDVTGAELVKFDVVAEPHHLRIADGYDDAYHLAPQRIVDAMYGLGYRDWYNLYIGLSHHHALAWSAIEARFIVDPSKPVVNAAARAWFDDLVVKLVAKGFSKIVVSISYEIIHYQMPLAWRQLDSAGDPGRSGWVPPSEFISPCSTAALDYIIALGGYLVGRVSALGGTPYFQIGEPWWWDGAYTSGGPCFYDPSTEAAFVAETGSPVPTPKLASSDADFSAPEQRAFLDWLRDRLGASTDYILAGVKAAYPDIETTILVFTPQIFSKPMLEIVNLPVDNWKAPALDFIQLEDYDWIIDRNWAAHATTWRTGLDVLGYPPSKTHYFSGFNLASATAEIVWPAIFAGIRDGYQRASVTFVWARPQIWRDHIVWDDREMITIGSEY